MKRLLSALIFFWTLSALGSPGQLTLKGGSWSFATENVRASAESSSGVGAYAVELGYRVGHQWMLSFGVNLIMSDLIQGSSGYGVDVGVKYFPLSASGTDAASSETVELVVQEPWRPYVGLFVRQRIFGLAVSTSYLGPGVSAGLDYSLGRQWLINGEVRYDTLYGQGEAVATQVNLLLGVGYEF
jgi:hypothetical protein